VVPTVVDADTFRPTNHPHGPVPVVGWIGTHSTAAYLLDVIPALQDVATRHNFLLKIVGSGRQWQIPGVNVVSSDWRLENEVSDYQSLDIGLYPVRDDEWGRGKTGFKPIVYMSCGAACIASPVGGVNEFLIDNVNGMVARDHRDWIRTIETLLRDPSLRGRLAAAGRATVENVYCLKVQAPRLVEILSASVRS
jgi:glycosyltransferase involved in cell wall biosynthesis